MKKLIPWNELDHIRFEELAMAYAHGNHPEYDWVATALTRDGNRDGYARFKRVTMGVTTEHEAWMEAKYSKKSGTVGRNRMDSTIVSGLLYGNVKVIMFITNGYIPKDYILRAQKVFIQSSDQHLLFIDNPNLAYWLCDNPEIYRAFFGADSSSLKQPEPMAISGLNIIPRSDYNRALYSRVRNCQLNSEYMVNILVDSNVKARVEIAVTGGEGLALPPSKIQDIIPGKNSFWRRLTVTSAGPHTITATILRGLSDKEAIEKSVTINGVGNSRPSIVHSSQLKIATSIINQLNRDIHDQRGATYCLGADGGMGKSYILELLQGESFAGASLHRFELTGSELIDSQQLCRAVLIFNFGVIYNADEIYETLHRSEIKIMPLDLVRQLLGGLENASNAVEALRNLSSNADNQVFLSPLSRSNHKVLFFDDVHKASPLISQFIQKIAKAIVTYRPNTSAVFAFRQDQHAQAGLITGLIGYSSLYNVLEGPSCHDVLNTFSANKLSINEETLSSYLSGKPIATITLCNVIDEIRRRIDDLGREDGFSSSYIHVFKEVLYGRHTIIEDAFRKAKEYYKILDIIYAYSSGICKRHFDCVRSDMNSEAIDHLARCKLVRIEDGRVYPYHDTYKETYNKLRNGVHKTHVGKAISRLKSDPGYPRVDCLGIIIQCGKRYATAHIEEAVAERDRMRAKAIYGPMLSLSQAICETVDKQPRILPEYDILKSFFIYAECLNHCGESQKARSYFDRVWRMAVHGNGRAMDVRLDGLALEAQAEVLSLDYWDMKASSTHIQRISDFMQKTRELVLIANNSPRHMRAYLTALNRLMTTQLLVGDYPAADDCFAANLAESDRLSMANYRAYAYSDYAKGLYARAPRQALALHEEARKQYSDLGNQQRRFLVGEVERSYLAMLCMGGSINKLYDASNTLLENGLYSEYRNAVMKISAILLSKGAYREAMSKMACYVAIMKSGFGNRATMLISNLLAAYHHGIGNEGERNVWVKRHHSIAQKIGLSYSNIPESNYVAPLSAPVQFAIPEHTEAEAFFIDPRLW